VGQGTQREGVFVKVLRFADERENESPLRT
jgi:hypothetical protein